MAIPEIDDGRGGTIKLGCLPPKNVRVSAFPSWSDLDLTLPESELVDVIRRDRFDPSWVKNQGAAGSCNGWAGASVIAKTRNIDGAPRVDLSGSSLYAQINHGQDEGSILEDGMKALHDHGVLPTSMSKPDQIYIQQYPPSVWEEAKRFKLLECHTIETELELVSALNLGYMCVVAVHVGNTFQRLNADGIAGSDPGMGNHAVHVDGCKRGTNGQWLFDMENSWGLSFGQNGRAYLTWNGHLAQTRQYHQFYAVRDVVEDTEGCSPPKPLPVAA